MKNQQSRPTDSAPFPEVNVTSFSGCGHDFNRGRRHGRGCYNRNHSYNKNIDNH